MKAMSLGLIKGIIDEVEQNFRVTWIKPRMLSREKVAIMAEKLNKWSQDCTEQLKTLEGHCGELLQG